MGLCGDLCFPMGDLWVSMSLYGDLGPSEVSVGLYGDLCVPMRSLFGSL